LNGIKNKNKNKNKLKQDFEKRLEKISKVSIPQPSLPVCSSFVN
jgi:hypothetical protein